MKKAPVYAVAQLTVHDRARYEAYVRRFAPVLAHFGGQLLATGRATQQLARWLGGNAEIEAVPLSRETPDRMLGSYWAHPEHVLDADARAATSGLARMPPEVAARVVAELARDLEDGTWERNHAELRDLDTLDVGLRLTTARPHAESVA